MAKKTPDAENVVVPPPAFVLHEGPFAGPHADLPEGAQVIYRELHIPSALHKVVAIYQITDPEGGVPTYRLSRTEPIY